ncbi:MAG: hypothetical protein E7353_02255 [Clostridiales bacterium]|nr:hypothetical protein [Clostridiales bacterium]
MEKIRESELMIQEQNLVEVIGIINAKKYSVPKSDKYEVIVVDNDGVKRIKRIENYVLNPHKTSNPCSIYFIKAMPQKGSWGGNIQYPEERVLGEDPTVINLRLWFSFSVIRGDRFISLLDGKSDIYTTRYVLGKLRSKMGFCVKQTVLKYIKQHNVSDFLCNFTNVEEELMSKINETIMYEYGITIDNLSLEAEKANI